MLRTGFGIFSDILPGSVADLIGTNPPYVEDLPGRAAGHGRRHRRLRPECRTAPSTPPWPRIRVSVPDSRRASSPARLPRQIRQLAFRRSRSRRCPDGKLHAPYFMEWSFGIEHQFGTTASLQAQYVGTRAVNQPYLTQVNGYQTVCQGCFAPFPYLQPTDPRFGAVTQFSTGANSHYNGLQLTAMKRLGHGLQGQINYTWSRCMDTVSNGGFLQFSAGGILSPLPGDLARDYGPCDYDIRHNLNAQYVYQLPVKVRNHALGYA